MKHKIESRLLPANAPGTRADRVSSFMRDVMGLPADKAFVLEAKEETRSMRQNKYLWGVAYRAIVEFMRDHHGRDYSDEAIHETLKELFLPSRVEQLASREVRIYRTTTKLTKREFCEYVEHVVRWAAEFGCVIPEPDPDLVAQKQKVAA